MIVRVICHTTNGTGIRAAGSRGALDDKLEKDTGMELEDGEVEAEVVWGVTESDARCVR